jgi:hypothetical protein
MLVQTALVKDLGMALKKGRWLVARMRHLTDWTCPESDWLVARMGHLTD